MNFPLFLIFIVTTLNDEIDGVEHNEWDLVSESKRQNENECLWEQAVPSFPVWDNTDKTYIEGKFIDLYKKDIADDEANCSWPDLRSSIVDPKWNRFCLKMWRPTVRPGLGVGQHCYTDFIRCDRTPLVVKFQKYTYQEGLVADLLKCQCFFYELPRSTMSLAKKRMSDCCEDEKFYVARHTDEEYFIMEKNKIFTSRLNFVKIRRRTDFRVVRGIIEFDDDS